MLSRSCRVMLQTAQSTDEVAANDIMAEEEQVAAKAAAKKAKKQKQKAKKHRAPQQASSNTDLLTMKAMSASKLADIASGQRESRAAAEQPHHASAACVKEASCIGTAAAGSASFTAGVSHQVLSCATPTQAPNPQPAKPVSTLLADSHFRSPGASGTVQAGKHVLMMRLYQMPMLPQAAPTLSFMTGWTHCMI